MPSRAWTSIAVFILVPLVCWAWIAAMAHDMYGPMTGASAWMMTPVWDARHLLLLWAMGAVMMTGMMLPSAAPMILLSGRERSGLFGLGYLFVWTAFSAGAVGLQWLLTTRLILTPMMEVSSAKAGAILLAFAGVYQWTPFKHACLSSCQAPMALVTRRWRSGRAGAF